MSWFHKAFVIFLTAQSYVVFMKPKNLNFIWMEKNSKAGNKLIADYTRKLEG